MFWRPFGFAWNQDALEGVNRTLQSSVGVWCGRLLHVKIEDLGTGSYPFVPSIVGESACNGRAGACMYPSYVMRRRSNAMCGVSCGSSRDPA